MIIFDASTLILLAKIDLLSILSKEIDIVITDTVKEESTVKKDLFDSKMILSLIEKKNITVGSVKNISIMSDLMKDFNMDKGEASTLVLYQEIHGELIATDDGQLIKAAKLMDIPFATSITFLIRTAQKDLIQEKIALEKLKKLEKFGWYKADIIEDAKKKIKGGEY